MKKANPKAVGGFVVGAVLLAAIAVIVFGSGRLFQERSQLVAFFSGSLQGLRIGAPVQFRGVEIGTVTDIYVQMDPKTLEFLIPVILKIDLDHVRGLQEAKSEGGSRLDQLIKLGLRAQLNPQSLVTGQQAVQLILSPDTPVHLVETDLPYGQIPTIPSKFSQMEQSIGSVLADISDVLNQLKDVFAENKGRMDHVVANIADATNDVKATMSELRKAAGDVSQLTAEMVQKKEAVFALIENSNETILSYKALGDRANAVVAANEDALSQSIAGLHEVEAKMSDLAATADAVLSENRRGIRDFTNDGLYEIRNLAVDAQAAVEQFRRVMEEMERDPARFFLGKSGQVEVK